MPQFTPDQMLAFAEKRNVETGRRTDYIEWIRICEINYGQGVYVGIQTRAQRITASGEGEWVGDQHHDSTFGAIGVVVIGPTLVDGGPVQITCGKPLAVANRSE